MKTSQQGEELREECLVRGNSIHKSFEAGRLVRTKSKTIVMGAWKSSGHGCEVMLERLVGDRVCRALWATMNGVLWPPLVIRTTGRKIPGQGGLGECQLSVRTFTLTSERLVSIYMAQNLVQGHL